jgi:hypothetical protein
MKSDFANGRKPMPNPNGPEVVNVLIALPVTAGQTALNDIYEMCELPEDCALVDAVYAASDIDTNGTPAHAMSFGVINSGGTDLDTTLEASIQVGRAGTAARMTPTVVNQTVTTDGKTRKKLGYKVTTASATGAAGTVYLNLSYRSAAWGA